MTDYPFEDIEWKFRAPNQDTLSILINQELWFPEASTLNDPFDNNPSLFFDPFISKVDDNYIQDLFSPSQVSKQVLKLHAMLKEIKQGVLSLSLSDKEVQPETELLMWAHYADDHKGVALGFDFDQNVEPDPHKFDRKTRTKVHYSTDASERQLAIAKCLEEIKNDRPLMGLQTGNSDRSILELANFAKKFKSSAWRYENEVRYFSTLEESENTRGAALNFGHQELKHIIFGCRCEKRFRDTILNVLIKGYDINRISLWAAYPCIQTLKMKFVCINDK